MVAVTVFAVLVPSAMAYGELAGVESRGGCRRGSSGRWSCPRTFWVLACRVCVMGGPEANQRHHHRCRGRTPGWRRPGALCRTGSDDRDPRRCSYRYSPSIGRAGFYHRLSFPNTVLVGSYILGATLIVIGSQLGKMFGISLESDEFFRQVARADQPPGRNPHTHLRYRRRMHHGALHPWSKI